MNRVAMKSVSYLPDFQFYRSKEHQPFLSDKNDIYEGDDFKLTETLFDFDGALVCWIGMDMAGCSDYFYEMMREGVNKVADTPFDTDHFYVNGTHTHSGPAFSKSGKSGPGSGESKEDLDDLAYYCASLAGKLYKELIDELKPFTAEIKVVNIQGAYSNRNSLDGPCDKAAVLLKFINSENGSTIGMWFSMNCHSTMIFPHNEHLSSDLVGMVYKNVAAHYGVPVQPNCGSQGDTSTRLTRHRTGNPEDDVRELHRIVKEVTDQVLATDDGFEPIRLDRFEVKNYCVAFDYKLDPRITDKRIENIKKELETETNRDQIRLKNDALRALQGQVGRTDFHGELHCKAINMGELKWAVIPGELVASLGLRIVKHEPHDHRMVVCYINSRGCGYLVEKEEYGKNFESLSSIIPVGIPEVIADMAAKELDQFALLEK
jgi:hypothetical protein